jgi:hypothetical protein
VLPALQACGGNVLVQNLLEQVMHWHFVLLAAFFMKSQPPARAFVIAIMHLGLDRSLIATGAGVC